MTRLRYILVVRSVAAMSMLLVACGSRSALDSPAASRDRDGAAEPQAVVCHAGDPLVKLGSVPIGWDHRVRYLATDGVWLFGTSATLWSLPCAGGAQVTLGAVPANVLTAANGGVYFNGTSLDWVDHTGQNLHTILENTALFVVPPEAFVFDTSAVRVVSISDGTTLGTVPLSSGGVTSSFAVTDRYFHQFVLSGGKRMDNRIDRITLKPHDVMTLGFDDGPQVMLLPPAPSAACIRSDCALDEAAAVTHLAYDVIFLDDAWTYSNNTLGFLRTNLRTLAVEVLIPHANEVTAVAETNGCLYVATTDELLRLSL
jgi:hypothetical protein